jgi:hypothetical protein
MEAMVMTKCRQVLGFARYDSSLTWRIELVIRLDQLIVADGTENCGWSQIVHGCTQETQNREFRTPKYPKMGPFGANSADFV